ncbi:MAG: putative sulfate exporter family transporter [Pseudomonadota bacterium]
MTFVANLRPLLPGLAVAVVVAMASMFVGEHYGGPVMLFALLIGIAFHFLYEEGPCRAGIDVAGRQVLKIGVALLGVRITFEEIFALGWSPIIMVASAVAATICFGVILSSALGLGRRFGVLTGGAVAICGASAALALASVLPKDKDSERFTLFTVIGVTTLSTVAMVLYPVLTGLMDFDHRDAGVFLGGTIHDVAQVVGAGYSVSLETGDVATFTKMLRVAMLLPVVLLVAFLFGQASRGMQAAQGPAGVPLFLIGFAVMVVISSLGLLPGPVKAGIEELSRWCLVTAIAALGMKTSLKAMAQVGGKAIGLIIAQTVFLALIVLGVIIFLD